MRTALMILVAFTALGGALAHAQFSVTSYTVSIGSLTLNVGGQGSVDLRTTDITDPVGAWTIEVAYDANTVSVVECSAAENSTCDPEHANNTIRLTGASATGLVHDTTLATITFRCASDGSSPLSLTPQVFGIPEDIVEVQTEDGAITCQEVRWFDGDANCDGRINSLDALAVLQFDVGLLPALPFPDGGDSNQDGIISSFDALLILQFDAGLMPGKVPNACISIPPGPGPV